MQSIGERLEEARKRKGTSLREAAEATKIRGDYLQQFETNKFNIGLSEIYTKSFLRSYASYLKLPADKILSDYKALSPNDHRARPINREVYGRMDLSVASADKAGAEPPSKSEPEPGPSPSQAPRKAATYMPHASTSPSMDKAILLKFGGLIAGVVIVITLLVWAVGALGSRKPAANSSAALSDQTALPPPANVPMLRVVASGPVKVTLQQKADKTILFSGSLNTGESRSVPRLGNITVTADAPQYIKFDIGGNLWPMPAGQNVAEIVAPVAPAPATP